MVDDLTEVVAALDAVLYLTEDFANFVFDGVRLIARLGLEAVEIGKELLVDEIEKVIAAQRGVVVNLAVLALRRSPRFPAVGLVEDVGSSCPPARPRWPYRSRGHRGILKTGAKTSGPFSRARWCSQRLSRERRRCF